MLNLCLVAEPNSVRYLFRLKTLVVHLVHAGKLCLRVGKHLTMMTRPMAVTLMPQTPSYERPYSLWHHEYAAYNHAKSLQIIA